MPPTSRAPAAASRPLRRDAEENRRRLLAAGREVFAESGLDATLDEVAARAGVGVGTAYRRFANKEELIAALSQERTAQMARILDDALAAAEPWSGIVAYLEGSLALHAGDRGLKELFLGSARYREVHERGQAQLRPRLEELVARATRAGVLRAGVQATDLALAQVMLSALPDVEAAGTIPTWRRFLPLVLDGLCAGHDDPLPGRALSERELGEAVSVGRRTRRSSTTG